MYISFSLMFQLGLFQPQGRSSHCSVSYQQLLLPSRGHCWRSWTFGIVSMDQTVQFFESDGKDEWLASSVGRVFSSPGPAKIDKFLDKIPAIVSRTSIVERSRCWTEAPFSLPTTFSPWWRGSDISQRWSTCMFFPGCLGAWVIEVNSKITWEL